MREGDRLDVKKDREWDARYGIEDVSIFKEHAIVETDELLTAEWPKQATIRGAILAVACRLKALDFSTGERLSVSSIETEEPASKIMERTREALDGEVAGAEMPVTGNYYSTKTYILQTGVKCP